MSRTRALLVAAILAAACGKSPVATPTTVPPTTATPGGAPATLTSCADSLVWTQVADDSVLGGSGYQEMNAVVEFGSQLVAVGTSEEGSDLCDAAVWRSTDGRDWVRVTDDQAILGGPGNQTMNAVAVGGPGLVAVGTDNPAGRPQAAVWTSADGSTWSRVADDHGTLGGSDIQGMWAIAASSSEIVAVGYDSSSWHAAVWVSTDGISWADVTLSNAVFDRADHPVIRAIAAIRDGFVTGGHVAPTAEPRVSFWGSIEGREWWRAEAQSSATAPGSGEILALTDLTEGVVAAGRDTADGSAAVWITSGGEPWTRVTSSSLSGALYRLREIRSLTSSVAGLIAVGHESLAGAADSDAAVWVSPDGTAWSWCDAETLGGPGDQVMNAVTALATGYVAVGSVSHPSGTDAAVWRASRP